MAGWSIPPGELMRVVEEDITTLQKEVVIYALTRIVMTSPVDTGAFRGNHRVSIGTKDMTADPQHKDRSGTATLHEGADILAGLTPYTTVYIQNNLPYAEALENGHSQQAPGGVYAVVANDVRERFS